MAGKRLGFIIVEFHWIFRIQSRNHGDSRPYHYFRVLKFSWRIFNPPKYPTTPIVIKLIFCHFHSKVVLRCSLKPTFLLMGGFGRVMGGLALEGLNSQSLT